eukprot:CAMPEP_0171903292 /NCGR_PEP_ID=MMETSP0993-20121228/2818_1 /TAXON_ID=483369 /ORGANISM="non described non described, Strain CCMP2098" /LENGTH=222 /DNA_ID=CAMNT_0012533451 /DNA_START=67 /DNA_END=732 /DNA_ORIENTATION=+
MKLLCYLLLVREVWMLVIPTSSPRIRSIVTRFRTPMRSLGSSIEVEDLAVDRKSVRKDSGEAVRDSTAEGPKRVETVIKDEMNIVTEAQLLERTIQTLDWPRVLEALEHEAATVRGRRCAASLELLESRAACEEAYQAVREAGQTLVELPYLGGAMDVEVELQHVVNGNVLEVADLIKVAEALGDLSRLRKSILANPAATGLAAELAVGDSSQSQSYGGGGG